MFEDYRKPLCTRIQFHWDTAQTEMWNFIIIFADLLYWFYVTFNLITELIALEVIKCIKYLLVAQ